MRPKWVAYMGPLALAAMIAAGGFLSQWYLARSAESLAISLEQVKIAVERQEWSTASTEFKRFYGQWQRVRRNWELFFDHMEMDNLEMRFSRTIELLAERNQTDSRVELGEAIMLVRHIPDLERPSLPNIF